MFPTFRTGTNNLVFYAEIVGGASVGDDNQFLWSARTASARVSDGNLLTMGSAVSGAKAVMGSNNFIDAGSRASLLTL